MQAMKSALGRFGIRWGTGKYLWRWALFVVAALTTSVTLMTTAQAKRSGVSISVAGGSSAIAPKSLSQKSAGSPVSFFGFAVNGSCKVGSCPASVGTGSDTEPLNLTITLGNGDQFLVYGSVSGSASTSSANASDQFLVKFIGNNGNASVASQSDTLTFDVYVAFNCPSGASLNWNYSLDGAFGGAISPQSSTRGSVSAGGSSASVGPFTATQRTFSQSRSGSGTCSGSASLISTKVATFGAGSQAGAYIAYSFEPGDENVTGSNHQVEQTTDQSSCGADGCSASRCGCTTWTYEPLAVSLALHDMPVGYTPPLGPSPNFHLYYSQRDVQQPTTFSYTNFGPQWTTTWLSYVTDNIGADGTAKLYQRGGGAELYSFGSSNTATGAYTEAILTRLVGSGGTTTGFTRTMRDGSVEQFTRASGNQFFMTAVLDPQGNALTVSYDSQMRITALTDALGQTTTLSYGQSGDPYKVTAVTDPFGRSAHFSYTAAGQLQSITDVLGITSSFTYGTGNFVKALTTPYGTTTFTFGDVSTDSSLGTTRFLTATDPLGRTTRIEFNQAAPGIADADSANTVPSGMSVNNNGLSTRNTFIWDPQQYQAATAGGGLDYTKARIIHWLYIADGSKVSGVPESIKEPLENRVWYDYPGQTSSYLQGTSSRPLHIGRVLDDGTTQLQSFQYNSAGNVTQVIDPLGRKTSLAYASNGVDVLSVSNVTGGASQQLASFTYNSQHKPVTVTGANGKTTHYEYNAAGQLTKMTDPLGHVTSYTYAGGYLKAVQGAIPSATYAFSYDQVGRLANATDSVGYAVAYEYDAADRPTKATFPDGTSTAFGYRLLDLASITDRLGHTTNFSYDAERELLQSTDALGNRVQYDYSPTGKLASLTDQNGHKTQWDFDLQSRITTKAYADGTRQTIQYEAATSRQRLATDAIGQIARYAYNADDTLASALYEGAINATADVSFGYDPAYRRIVSMTDGVGTTTYSYYSIGASPTLGANQLKSVTSPIAGALSGFDKVTYSYDELNRVISRSINGVEQKTAFDALGRISEVDNALDKFAYGYVDATSRLTTLASVKGVQLAMSYYDAAGDDLLKQMGYTTKSGSTLAQFGYGYNANDNVTSFTTGYLGKKLVAASGGAAGSSAVIASIIGAALGSPAYASDRSAQKAISAPLTTAGIVLLLLACTVSSLAWLAYRGNWRWKMVWLAIPAVFALVIAGCGGGGGGGGSSSGGGTTGGGTSLTTTSIEYSYDTIDRLLGAVNSDTKSALASYSYDPASNLTSIDTNGTAKSLSYTDTNAIVTGTYDANGSPTTLDSVSYSWDGANRLVSVVSGTKESDFTYDGLSRLVRIVDKQGGAITADKSYFWCGNERCLEHDNLQSGSPVSKQYFAQGMLVGATAYYYVTDRLGSVRQLVDAAGNVQAQYDYDPYGNATKTSAASTTATSGTTGSTTTAIDSDFGYAGYFHHAQSSLDFALYRAYDSTHGRWLNRDPIGEVGGINVYGYVAGNPLTGIDSSGLDTYLVNRDLQIIGRNAKPRWDPLTHTFVVVTNPDGSVAHTYSWGNSANPHGWNIDQLLDISTAQQAVSGKEAEWVGGNDLDPYIAQAFQYLNNPKFSHANGWINNNCKTEAQNLIDRAKLLKKIEDSYIELQIYSHHILN